MKLKEDKRNYHGKKEQYQTQLEISRGLQIT